MEDNLVWELQNNFAHTLIDLWTWVLMTHFIAVRWFWKFVWCTCLWKHDAHVHVVWCSWCMLVRLGHPQNELVTGGTITGWEGVCVASRILTTKIPSMLLVAVMWLQRTGCPRFRRGTFGYGTTTSPNKRDRVWVRSFHENACQYTQASQMHMLCNAYSKVTFIFIQKLWASPKRISSGLRDRIKQDWQETFWWVWDSSQNFWSDHNQHR
jgi:hypothetical protein